jgi:hypothetical protein
MTALATMEQHEIDTTHLIDLRPNGMLFLGAESFEEWSAIGQYLQRAAGSINWWLGDWMNRGETRFGETYAQAIEASGLAYQTLGNIKWVARAIPFSRRREELSWKHHSEVAALEDDEQDEWLGLAAEQSWSANTLRKEIKATKADTVRLVEVTPQMTQDEAFAATYGTTMEEEANRLIGRWTVAEREEGDRQVSAAIDALESEAEAMAPVVWPGKSLGHRLSELEKSICRMAAARIEEHPDCAAMDGPASADRCHAYTEGVLVGIDIAAPDWGRDLPGLIRRYMRRY